MALIVDLKDVLALLADPGHPPVLPPWCHHHGHFGNPFKSANPLAFVERRAGSHTWLRSLVSVLSPNRPIFRRHLHQRLRTPGSKCCCRRLTHRSGTDSTGLTTRPTRGRRCCRASSKTVVGQPPHRHIINIRMPIPTTSPSRYKACSGHSHSIGSPVNNNSQMK